MKDQQQQTSVTKHDLNLLHKKIIATDLIVQKYQDANKALLRLQTENDDLKQQIEQITNECCIFGKQVTECIQECDHLKEQIETLNSEKRELNEQLRQLQIENTNNYHEIMVLRQYESLKETNDQLSKTVERQQKQIAKLQLQVQRKSPIVYKPNKDTNEPSEKDIALKNSQKSVLELKLALGRLMNFIQLSKTELPTALNIRPVLKAHDINDDFLEREGEFVLKPVKRKSRRKVNQTVVVVQNDADADDDDDDDHGDFIDVTHNSVPSEPVNKPNSTADVIEQIPKASSRQEQKKKEVPKVKPSKKPSTKSRRKKDVSISDDPTGKLDDLASQLDNALSQTNQKEKTQNLPHFTSFLSDDDDEDRIHKSDKQLAQEPMYNPISPQYSSIPILPLRSSITIIDKPANRVSRNLSFFSDNEHDEHLQDRLSRTSSIIEQVPVSISSNNQKTMPSLQFDSITPMDIETPTNPTSYMSFLSEDDDDNNRSVTPIATPLNEQRSLVYQEYISSLEVNSSTSKKDTTDKTQPLDIDRMDVASTPLSLNKQPEAISKSNQDSLSSHKDQLKSSVSINRLDSKRIEIVSRLLNVLTHPPIPLQRLRLIRRRIPKKQVTVLSDSKSYDKREEQANTQAIENNVTSDDHSNNQVSSTSMEEQPITLDQINLTNNQSNNDQLTKSMGDTTESITDIRTASVRVSETHEPMSMEEQSTTLDQINLINNQSNDDQLTESAEGTTESITNLATTSVYVLETEEPVPMKEQSTILDHIDEINNQVNNDQLTQSMDDTTESITDVGVALVDVPETQEPISIEEQSATLDQINSINCQLNDDQFAKSTEGATESIIDHDTTPVRIPETQEPIPMEEQLVTLDDVNKTNAQSKDDQFTKSIEGASESIIDNDTSSVDVPETQESIPMQEQSESIGENVTSIVSETENLKNLPAEAAEQNNVLSKKYSSSITIRDTSSVTVPETQSSIGIEQPIINETPNLFMEQPPTEVSKQTNTMINEIPQKPIDSNLTSEQTTNNNMPLTESLSKESKRSSQSKINPTEPVSSSVIDLSKQPLKPFQISVITRLLNLLTKLPVKPLKLPMPYPLRKRKIVVNKPSAVHPDPTSRSSNRMQTRSLSSIRACIARCNQPKTVNRKRTATESISSLPPIPKRMKSTKTEQQNQTNEYTIINKFINSLSKEINDDLKKFLQQNLHEDLALFNDTIYRTFSDLLFSKCDIILRLVKQLHSYEESIKSLLVYIHSQSAVFQQYFINKSKQAFEFEIKQQPISSNRIKILNRLFFLTCSVFATSPVIVYARLFDIGYYLSHDIFIDALNFISTTCSSLISIDAQTSSSNVLLHQFLFDILKENPLNISLEYLENLLNAHHLYIHDQEDLLRCFILISRHQTWSWCSNELWKKFLFPLLNKTDDKSQQRMIILTILQYVLFIYKDNQDFKRDTDFHDQIEQLLLSLTTINNSETTVRDKILFVIRSCC